MPLAGDPLIVRAVIEVSDGGEQTRTARSNSDGRTGVRMSCTRNVAPGTALRASSMLSRRCRPRSLAGPPR